MIESFSFKNFRGFERLSVSGLKKINIVVGRSASGKTALLEAIRIAANGTPIGIWVLNNMRGLLVPIPQYPSREQYEAVWSSYFYGNDLKRSIEFTITNNTNQTASLRIFFDEQSATTPNVPSNVPHTTVISTIVPIAFERIDTFANKSTLKANILSQGNIFFEPGNDLFSASEFFGSTWQSNSQQSANWFSQLNIADGKSELVNLVSDLYDDIVDLSTETPFGIPTIYAELKSHKKFPISVVSGGLSRFLYMMIAIRTFKAGIVLIDEIENGIYYKALPKMWDALHKFANSSTAQLFVTTHSLENLKAVAPIIDKYPKDFSLIQTFQEEGTCKALIVSGKDAASAIESNIEIRH